MKELGLSQTELAKRMNVSRPYITKVLRQDVNFSFRTAAKLAAALKMDFFPELRPQEASDGYIVENILAELRGETATPLSNSNSEFKLYKNELR